MPKRKRIYRADKNAKYSDDMAAWIGLQMEIAESEGLEWGPRRLIEVCRPTISPGHSLFEWDVKKAAERHWIESAEHHLRHFIVEVVVAGNKTPVRATYPVIIRGSGKPIRGYASFDRVQSTPDLAKQVIEKAKAELRSWRNRYSLYRGVFGKVFAVIDNLETDSWQQPQSTASQQTATQQRQRRKAKAARPRKSK